MRGHRFIVAAGILLTACAAQPPADPGAAFRAFEDGFVKDLMRMNPDWAIQVGDYSHASELVVPDAAARKADLAFLEKTGKALAAFAPESLDPLLRADWVQIRNYLDSAKWSEETLKSWQWDPSAYNVATPFALLASTDYAPQDERLRTVLARLEKVPAYYAAAQANISHPTREHTQLAIQQNQGALEVFGDDLLKAVDGSGLSDREKSQFRERAKAARDAIQGYVDFLTKLEPTLTPDTARSFRLGREFYEPKFRYDIQSGFTVEELYHRALGAKERLQQDAEKQAKKLWPKYFGRKPMPKDRGELIAQVIGKVSAHHSKPERLLDDVKALLPRLADFVRAHELMEQDPTKPLVVRETPPYNPVRGVAIASIDAPGPFNPGAATYFNVQPMSDFSPEKQESFLREYNNWMLQILAIHEGIPGHYTQLLHANKAPSMVKSLLSSGPMIEGWAVYVQRMMIEQGWGNNEPEMWLMLDKFDLRTVCNTILDYSVHVLGMTEQDALNLLMHDAYQSETEARGKWRRVQLTSVQLTSYFAGFEEIYEFREQQKAALGPRFNLRDFHERFLSYGSVPVKTIKGLMKEPETAIAAH